MAVTELLKADLTSHCEQLKKKNGQNILNKFSDCDLKEENSKSWALTFLPLGPLKTEAQQGQMQES